MNNSSDSEVVIVTWRVDARLIACSLFSVLGIGGNIFVIVLGVKYTVRKNLHHLIINMAVADTLFLIMTLIFFWIRDQCILTFPIETSYRVSAFTLLIISIERFRATRQTLQRSRPYTARQRMTVLGLCWLIPMISGAYHAHDLCTTLDYTIRNFYISTVDYGFLILICVVIVIIGCLTVRQLSTNRAIHAHLTEEQRNLRTRRTRAAVRMVLSSAILYMCCWLPVFLLRPLHSIDSKLGIFDVPICFGSVSLCFIVSTLLPIVNSCSSPVLYIIFLADFRQAASKVLCCGRAEVNPPPGTCNSTELQPIPKNERR